MPLRRKKPKKAIIHVLREATMDSYEVFEHDSDLKSVDKKRTWTRTSDSLIDAEKVRHYFAVGEEPRTIDFPIVAKWIELHEKNKEDENVKNALSLFSRISSEKLQNYMNYRGVLALREEIKRPFSDIISWFVAGMFGGMVIAIMMGALGWV